MAQCHGGKTVRRIARELVETDAHNNDIWITLRAHAQLQDLQVQEWEDTLQYGDGGAVAAAKRAGRAAARDRTLAIMDAFIEAAREAAQ